MSELMTKQEIAKELLKPYVDDPTLCSRNEWGACKYKGPGGRMCVFERACTPEAMELLAEFTDAVDMLKEHGTGILQEKYRHIEGRGFWDGLQYCHDTLATGEVNLTSQKYKELVGEPYDG